MVMNMELSMARRANPKPRTYRECVALCVPGTRQRAYGLGPGSHGLRLVVSPSGTGAWVARNWTGGRSIDRGIGPLEYVTLAAAKRRAFELRASKYLERPLTLGPVPSRRPRKPNGPTFEELAAEVINERRPTFRGARTADQWTQTLRDHIEPHFGSKSVAEIERADVLAAFQHGGFWTKHHAQAQIVMGRVRVIFDVAIAKGMRSDNPADRATVRALPRVNGKAKHFDAIPHPQLGAALSTLEARPGAVALCIRLVALTGCRSTEARLADWSEVDSEARTWTIPAARTKANREHAIPLSDKALAVLAEARKAGASGLIFKGRKGGRMNPASLLARWKSIGAAGVIHGLRSSFRDWCGETGQPREVAEAALGHAVTNATEAAYFRSELLERRRILMQSWADYLEKSR